MDNSHSADSQGGISNHSDDDIDTSRTVLVEEVGDSYEGLVTRDSQKEFRRVLKSSKESQRVSKSSKEFQGVPRSSEVNLNFFLKILNMNNFIDNRVQTNLNLNLINFLIFIFIILMY